jgi:hypothetical protein
MWRRSSPDIVEDDLRPTAAVEHDPRRGDEQVPGPGLRRIGGKEGRSDECEPGGRAERNASMKFLRNGSEEILVENGY